MQMWLLGIAAMGFYSLSTIVIAHRLSLTDDRARPVTGDLFAPAMLGLLLHSILLYQLSTSAQGLSFGFFDSVSIVAALLLFTLFATMGRANTHGLGVILLPIAIVSIVLALANYNPAFDLHQLSPGLKVHVLLSFLAYSTLSLAALLSLILAYQNYQLHYRRKLLLPNVFPSLQSVESLMFQLISTGFVLLSLAVALGIVYTETWWTHKIIFSCLAWLVFAILLFGRYRFGWRGRTAIQWTLGGIFLLMIGFFGTKLVLEFIQ